MVSVTGIAVVDELKFNIGGVKLQVLCAGKLKHMEGESWKLPVSPFCAEKVSVVEPDCPGVAMLIVVGFAVMLKLPPISINVVGDVDPPKSASPLYCAVTLSSPSGICTLMPAPGGAMLESTATGAPNGVPLE
jgi:hypothetical protein